MSIYFLQVLLALCIPFCPTAVGRSQRHRPPTLVIIPIARWQHCTEKGLQPRSAKDAGCMLFICPTQFPQVTVVPPPKMKFFYFICSCQSPPPPPPPPPPQLLPVTLVPLQKMKHVFCSVIPLSSSTDDSVMFLI